MVEPVIYVIDDDAAMRASLAFLLEAAGMKVRTFESAQQFLGDIDRLMPGCIVTDVRMPEVSGLDLLRGLREREVIHPVIVITGHGDVPLAVEAMRAGAANFIEKPFAEEDLLHAIRSALADGEQTLQDREERERLRAVLDGLSPRERDVLQGVIDGKLNKVIAHELGISPRTVEVYRANMMLKTGAKGLSDLVRTVILART